MRRYPASLGTPTRGPWEGSTTVFERMCRANARLRRARRGPDPQGGFTLIELLVVIVILGVLAAVVVFSVQGLGDRGQESAIEIDERTIRTAQEAYCAQEGRYADGATLAAEGFLSEPPQYHEVDAQFGRPGGCNGSTYSIVRTELAAPPGSPARTEWAAAAGPAAPPFQNFVAMWRLPDGKVVAFDEKDPIAPTSTFSVRNPADGSWSALSDPTPKRPKTDGSNQLFNISPVLAGRCGDNCGKILHSFTGGSSDGPGQSGLYLIDANAAGAAQGEPQFEFLPTTLPSAGTNLMLQLLDNPSTGTNECGDNCGKVLVLNASAFGQTRNRLYDPTIQGTGAFAPLNLANICGLAQRGARGAHGALLPDGRYLIVNNELNVNCAAFFDPKTLQLSVAPIPPVPVAALVTTGAALTVAPPVLANGDLLFGSAAQPTSAGTPGDRPIYRPEYGADGVWLTSTLPSCGAAGSGLFCHILGSLPNGDVLAYTSTSGARRASPTGDAWVLDDAALTWREVGSFDPAAIGEGVVLDPRTGPCGDLCNKFFMVGSNGMAAMYTP